MGTPTKDRQQKWKAKQTASGKKSVNVMISAEVKEMIDKEKAYTGDTISHIIEQSVREHLRSAPSNRRRIDLDSEKLTDTQKVTLKIVRRQRSINRYSLSEIADGNNRFQTETLSGVKEWDDEEVQAALDYIDEHQLWYSL